MVTKINKEEMKTIFLLILTAVQFIGCHNQGLNQNTKIENSNMKDAEQISEKIILELYFNNGSLPPPYRYSYKIKFLDSGIAQLHLTKGYDEKDTKVFTKDYNLSEIESFKNKISSYKTTKKNENITGADTKIASLITKDGDDSNEYKIYLNDEKGNELFNEGLELFESNFQDFLKEYLDKFTT